MRIVTDMPEGLCSHFPELLSQSTTHWVVKQQKFIVLLSRRPEVCDQGVGRAGSFGVFEVDSVLSSLLDSRGFLAIFVTLWLVEASLWSLPSFSRDILPVECVCVQISVFSRLALTLVYILFSCLQPYLMIYRELVSKWGPMTWGWELGLQ